MSRARLTIVLFVPCPPPPRPDHLKNNGMCFTNQQISAVEAVREIRTTAGESLVSSSHPCMSALSPGTVDPLQQMLLVMPT